MLVVDASVLAAAFVMHDHTGTRARNRLRGENLAAPSLIDLEVLSVWRGLARAGKLPESRVEAALIDLTDLPIQRVHMTTLLGRCWELRHNLTTYDAAYVALAERLDAALVTADKKLAGSTGPRCVIEVLD